MWICKAYCTNYEIFVSRPQNDGPAERASTFILFADSYLKQTSDATYVTNTLKPGKTKIYIIT
jgi:hypothetical protein